MYYFSRDIQETITHVNQCSHYVSIHKFGCCFGGYVTRTNGGIPRRGKRIHIQVKSAGRRKSLRRGKAAIAPGRAPAAVAALRNKVKNDEKYFIPIPQRNSSIRMQHSLKESICKGQQKCSKVVVSSNSYFNF